MSTHSFSPRSHLGVFSRAVILFCGVFMSCCVGTADYVEDDESQQDSDDPSGGDASDLDEDSPIPQPDPELMPCDDIEVGVWEEITPAELTTGPTALVFDPINQGRIYLGSGDGKSGNADGVFRSDDCGATWEHVSTGTASGPLQSGIQWTMEINRLTPTTLYTNSGYGANGIFKSVNGGVDWLDITPSVDRAPGFVSRMSMDPGDPNHILLDWHEGCRKANGDADGPGCFHETLDGGQTWRGIVREDWPKEANAYLLHGETWLLAIHSGGLLRTEDSGATWEPVHDGHVGGHSAGRMYQSPTGAIYIGTTNGIIRSAPGQDGRSWTNVGGGSWIFGITGNGDKVFAHRGLGGGFATSPETDGTTWTPMTEPNQPQHSDGCSAQYMPGHDLLISSCGIDGVHRMKVR